jgi:alkyldihydroxyacetonephosphate synthase
VQPFSTGKWTTLRSVESDIRASQDYQDGQVCNTTSPQANPDALKWWGWGLESKTYSLDDKPQFWPYLLKTLKLAKLNKCSRVTFEEVRLPPCRLDGRTLTRLKRTVGADVSSEKYDRLTHSLGKSYLDLLNLRRGLIRNPPDAVAYPKDEREVAKLLSFARANRISIVPFAGGSSVVGGVEPIKPRGTKGAITVDLRRMKNVLDVDAISLTATVEAGILGPELEDELNKRGFTLGHFPQSFQFSGLGGWIATRSAGQVSTKYGKIEDMVESLTLVSPSGKLDTKAVPASASGPQLKQVLIGSEGTMGVITKAKLRIHRVPAVSRYEGLMFKSFRDGINAIRETMQSGSVPAMMRLSDPDETTVSLMLSSQSATTKLGLWLLERLGYAPSRQCVMILGSEGDPTIVKVERQVAVGACKRNGAFAIGKGVGATWLNERFELPYLRDVLLDHCILVDTLETATTWDKLEALHGAMKRSIEEAISEMGVAGVAFAHVSHAYPDGASIYYTIVAPQVTGKEVQQWLRIKKAATDCIMQNGGTLSHHHGIGKDHAPWIKQELGENGLALLRAIKKQLDPEGVMNPGKLLASN